MINIANNMKRLIFHQERQQLRIYALHRLKPPKTDDNLLKPRKTGFEQIVEYLRMSVMGIFHYSYQQMVNTQFGPRTLIIPEKRMSAMGTESSFAAHRAKVSSADEAAFKFCCHCLVQMMIISKIIDYPLLYC